MKDEVVIQVRGLRKQYRLGKINAGTLEQAIRERRERKKAMRRGETAGRGEGTFYALDGIDLTVRRGESLGIIGRNGAGKSTLLKILSRITAPTEGVVDLYGRVSSMLEVGTGFSGDMTGRENIFMNGAILGMTRDEIREKMKDIVRFSGVEDFLDTPVKRYSSGMYVRLGFSVATHLESDIVIMDEVLAVGDVDFQKKCIDRLSRSVKEQGKTVLFVSHNMNAVRQLCRRCIVLDRGRIVFDGDVEGAVSAYLGTDRSLPAEVEFGPEYRQDDHLVRPVIRFSINRMRLISGDTPVFSCEEEAVLELACRAEVPLRGVAFRFEVWYQDHTKAATALSGNALDLEAGEHSIRVVFPLRHLTPGGYRADIVAFQYDGRGGEYRIDAVYPGFVFQIRPTAGERYYVEWRGQFWGAVRLDDLTLRLQ